MTPKTEKLQRVQIVARQHPHFEEYGRFTGHIVTMKFGTREGQLAVENIRMGQDSSMAPEKEVDDVE